MSGAATRAERALAAAGFGGPEIAGPPSSGLTFPDGEPFHVEIASVEGPEALRAVIDEAGEQGIRVHRVSQGSGIMLQKDDEVLAMLELGRTYNVDVCLFAGPRGSWDTGVQATTKGGGAIGAALRGRDQLLAAVEDVQHGCELGLRSVLVSDIGLLSVLGKMRASGDLPPDLTFKVSASFPVSNPATAALLADLGGDTLNIAVDLSVAQIAGLRAAVRVPLDIYIEGPDDFGGPLRYYDVPELVRTAAPLHLKFAVRNAASLYPYGRHLRQHLLDTARERVRRAALALQILGRWDAVEKAPIVNNTATA